MASFRAGEGGQPTDQLLPDVAAQDLHGGGSGRARPASGAAAGPWPLRLLRAMYWLTGVEAAVFIPFFSVFMAKCGLSGSHVGLVMGAKNLAAIVSTPAWGSALDASTAPARPPAPHASRRDTATCSVVHRPGAVPPVTRGNSRSGGAGGGERRCSRALVFSTALVCRLLPATLLLLIFWNCGGKASGGSGHDAGHSTALATVLAKLGGVFPPLVAATALAAVFAAPVQLYLDTSTLRILDSDRGAYGRSRAFLSVGMGVGSLAAGFVFDSFSARAVWAALVALMCFDSGVGVVMSRGVEARLQRGVSPTGDARDSTAPPKCEDRTRTGQRVSYGTDGTDGTDGGGVGVDSRIRGASSGSAGAAVPSTALGRVMRVLANWHLALFLAIAIVLGVGNATYDVYIVLFMEQLHAPGWMVGAAVAIGCASNVVLFLQAQRLLRTFGCRAMLASSMLAFCVRVYLYSLADKAWQVLPVQLLHGINFSVMWAGGVEFTRQHASDGSVATAQSLFQGSFFGVGGLLGLVVGGWLFDTVGPRDMFLIKGAATAVALCVFVAAEVVPHACARRGSKACARVYVRAASAANREPAAGFDVDAGVVA